MVTTYAIHAKLKQIEDYLATNPDGQVLLFFDELNRTTRETMAELMNLILNKEINGYKVPDSVFMVAAMNPSSTTEGFEGNNSYGVTDMDAASKNRLVWLRLDLDAKSWLDWAISKPNINKEKTEKLDLKMIDKLSYETVIDNDIIEFIASFPDMLNVPREDVDATPSARTWEFTSDILRTYRLNKGVFNHTHLEACIQGCIGFEAYTSFMTFLNNNSNPLIKPEEWFKTKDISKLLEKLDEDTMPRQVIQTKNVVRFVAEELPDAKQADYKKMCDILAVLPADMLITVLRYMRTSYEALFNKMKRNSDFLALYRESTKIVG